MKTLNLPSSEQGAGVMVVRVILVLIRRVRLLLLTHLSMGGHQVTEPIADPMGAGPMGAGPRGAGPMGSRP